jgi:hypothetical protein
MRLKISGMKDTIVFSLKNNKKDIICSHLQETVILQILRDTKQEKNSCNHQWDKLSLLLNNFTKLKARKNLPFTQVAKVYNDKKVSFYRFKSPNFLKTTILQSE